MQLIVAVNCSSKKTVEPGRNLCARDLSRAALSDLAEEWRSRVRFSGASAVRATDLYAGRGFALARDAAERAGAGLYVVSAGMGIVGQDARVPPYSLSVAPNSEDSILSRARGEKFTASDWWSALVRPNGEGTLAQLMREHPRALLLVAATRPYIGMVQNDLASLSSAQADRVRILGLSQREGVPENLQPCVMPYDGRLDDERLGLSGTRFDFAARALTHFAGLIGSDNRIRSPQEHARRVRLSLSRCKAPEKVQRMALDAAALRREVRVLKRAGESKTSALKALRHDLGFACEQQRFFRAWEFA